jgi:hypothetical protein
MIFDEERAQLPVITYCESPPDGDLNSHMPWSEWDEQDIRYAVEHGQSLAETAIFLCRMPQEVSDKANAMGLRFQS